MGAERHASDPPIAETIGLLPRPCPSASTPPAVWRDQRDILHEEAPAEAEDPRSAPIPAASCRCPAARTEGNMRPQMRPPEDGATPCTGRYWWNLPSHDRWVTVTRHHRRQPKAATVATSSTCTSDLKESARTSSRRTWPAGGKGMASRQGEVRCGGRRAADSSARRPASQVNVNATPAATAGRASP